MILASNVRAANGIVDAIQNDPNIKLFHYSGLFYLYEDGYYKQIIIENKIYSYIANTQAISTNIIHEVVGLMRMNPAFLLDESIHQIEPERYINFKNGILDLDERKLIPHTPDIIFFSKIPFDYNPSAMIDPITEKLLENFIKTETPIESALKRRMLFEYLGVVISNVRGLKNFLFLLGVKDTGKSTFCGLIMRLIGEGNYSSLPIADLSEASFYLYGIVGKKANILTETDDTPIKDITTLKKLTGGKEEKIQCHIKHVKNAQLITPRAMLIFAGNSIPPIWNGGDKKAFIERMIPIQFESPVSEKDKIPNILDKISMEYIIKEAIERLYEFLDNNKVFTQPNQSKAMRQGILNDSDIIHAFVEDCDTNDKDYKIHTKDFYAVFNIWAEANGYTDKKITQQFFTRRLKEIGQSHGFEGKKVSINGTTSLAGFVGIKPPSLESLGYWGTGYDSGILVNPPE